MHPDLLRLSALAVCSCAVAQGQPGPSIAAVNPTPKSLGVGWQSKIEVLIDPGSKPSEILGDDQVSVETLREWRRSAQDTNYTLSGWVRSRLDFISGYATNRYYLHIDRFRNEAALVKEFNRLLAPGPGHPPRSFPRDIGEAAVVQHDRGAVTLWFRRGHFLVSVSSFGARPSSQKGGSMVDLAKAVDRNIINAEKESK